jgi:DNA-binding transcriptional LysR family regulator
MLAATAARLPNVRETVTVSSTEFVIAERLAPALGQLFAASPLVSVDLQSQAHLVSLSARDADLAIRMSRPEGNSLLIRKIGQVDLGLFASATYIAGRAVSAIDLSRERLLIPSPSEPDSASGIPKSVVI